MKNKNLISVDFPQEKMQEVLNNLEEIKNKLDFLVELNAEEKNFLLKLGNKFLPFVEKAKQVLDANPEIMSPLFNIEEFKRDYQLLKNLTPILNSLNQLREAVEDTIFIAGSDVFEAALEIYSAIQINRDKIPGMDTIYNEMRE
ncbi:MAG: hypothetical protein N3F03_07320, partial [Ignavibacteria bacterium]|nr:hypothetical protein [Ignavibacteria bacterium]